MEKTKEVIRKFREKGFKITPQRIAILKSLENHNGHPSAEEIYRRIRRDYPSISLTTVYKTLETLCEMEEVSEVHVCKERVFYDAGKQPHHHLICRKCSRIQDVPASIANGIELPKPSKYKFYVTQYRILFFGYCSRCRPAGHA